MNKQQAIDTLSSFKREDYMMTNAAAVKVARFLTTQGPATILHMLHLAHAAGMAEATEDALAMASRHRDGCRTLRQMIREMME